MQPVLIIIQKERIITFNNFVSGIRNKYGTSLIELDNHSDSTMQDYAIRSIKDSGDSLKVYFYSEGEIGPGATMKLVNELGRQKQRIEALVFEGENRFFIQFKTALQP